MLVQFVLAQFFLQDMLKARALFFLFFGCTDFFLSFSMRHGARGRPSAKISRVTLFVYLSFEFDFQQALTVDKLSNLRGARGQHSRLSEMRAGFPLSFLPCRSSAPESLFAG